MVRWLEGGAPKYEEKREEKLCLLIPEGSTVEEGVAVWNILTVNYDEVGGGGKGAMTARRITFAR